MSRLVSLASHILPSRYIKHSHLPHLPVPPQIVRPPYAYEGSDGKVGYYMEDAIEIKSKEEQQCMREAGRIAGLARAYVAELVKPGVTTEELDNKIHEKIIEMGAYPSPVNYMGFPKSSCASVNDVICHGIPDSRILQEGDVLSIDVSCFYKGFHGDCCGSFVVGVGNPRATKIVEAAAECLEAGLNVCGPGKEFKLIGSAITKTAKEMGCGIVDHFTGHGVGRNFHIAPPIIHTINQFPGVMLPGMVFTVEPCVIELNGRKMPKIAMMNDGWTIVPDTKELFLSAQFEETVLITESGVEYLTRVPYKYQNIL